jgi:hypothetical protein
MRQTFPPNPHPRHYRRTADVAVTSYRELVGAPTDGAAHQKAMKVVADFFALVESLRIQGKAPTITRLFELFCDEMDRLPAPPVAYAIRKDGHSDRAQDEAREECLLEGMTYQELMTLRARTHREITDKLQLNRSIDAHVVAMPLEARR